MNFMHLRSARVPLATWLLVLATNLPAQDYRVSLAVSGLDRPTGIVTGRGHTLFVTQVPTPGIPGSQGGRNSVDAIHLPTGRITNLTRGEPQPINLAVDKTGTLYWTCKSAGVILERSRQGTVNVFLSGLHHPSGIAADHRGLIFFTQLPTPGIPGSAGGMNTVNASDGTTVWTLTSGEPEPTDIAVARDGTAYWTCRSAGVILQRNSIGDVSLVLDGLANPNGIAYDDASGTIAFTEVPTPGLAGDAGGANRVSVLRRGESLPRIVSSGEPEPVDVTFGPGGRLYWTCRTAGVILVAKPADETE